MNTDPGGFADASDRDLLARHCSGEPDAFGVLFARHRDRLWAVALRTTGHREDAADALQEAMISAFTRAEHYRGDAAVTTWLHRIVVNASLDRLRRNAVRRAEPLPDEPDSGEPGPLRSTPGVPDPLSAALATETREILLAALDRISPDQKIAVILVDMEGYSVEQAAEILQCPTGTVKSRCSRGRARLLEELAGTGLGPAASDLQDRSTRRAAAGAPPDAASSLPGAGPVTGPVTGPGTGPVTGRASDPDPSGQPSGEVSPHESH